MTEVDSIGNPSTKYGIFFNSVVPTYLNSQPTTVGNKWLNKWLFIDEKTQENKPVANYIPTKCLKFASMCLESSLTQWIKCTYRELSSVLAFFKKIFWCAKGGQKEHLF